MNVNQWATGLDQFWSSADGDSEIMLALEPTLLLEVAAPIGEKFESIEQAEQDFINAVRDYVTGRTKPWRPEPLSESEPPRFLLLIAAQIYAASRMADDPKGTFTDRAYYVQLEDVVGRRAMGANFAAEHGPHHQELWRGRLLEWAAKHDCEIRLPPDRRGVGRHVCLPKSQAALRLADLHRLPLFFQRCGYRPGATYADDRVERDLELYQDDHSAFPRPWARQVLSDPLKLPNACRQVIRVLRDWDGRWEIPEAGRRGGKKNDRSNWWLAIYKRQARLVGRFGKTLDAAEIISTAQLGELLAGNALNDALNMALTDGLMLCRYDEDDLAFKQVDCVEAGDQCLVAASQDRAGATEKLTRLIRSTNVATVVKHYRATNAGSPQPDNVESLTGVPDGCQFLILRIADPLPPHEIVSDLWHALLRSPRPKLTPSGGLRLGRKRVWVSGAGPHIRIAGQRLPRSITINNQEVQVTGRVVQSALLLQPGHHQVRARIDGVNTQCVVDVRSPDNRRDDLVPGQAWRFADDWPTWDDALPETSWLFGMRPNQLEQVSTCEVDDDRLTAIRILAGGGLTSRADKRTSDHPLVHWLLETSNDADC